MANLLKSKRNIGRGVLTPAWFARGCAASRKCGPVACSHGSRHARSVFSGALAAGGIVKAIRVSDGQRISNARVKPKGDIAGATERFWV